MPPAPDVHKSCRQQALHGASEELPEGGVRRVAGIGCHCHRCLDGVSLPLLPLLYVEPDTDSRQAADSPKGCSCSEACGVQVCSGAWEHKGDRDVGVCSTIVGQSKSSDLLAHQYLER